MKKAINFIFFTLIAFIFAISVYIFSGTISKSFLQLQARYLPCQKPITYAIGSFDGRFGMAESDFLSAVNQAVGIWENSINKNLFEQTEDGILKINLVYDYRQEATKKLSQLGIELNDNKATYDSLKLRYDSTYALYLQKKSLLDSFITQFEADRKEYESKVNYWNGRGDVSRNEYEKLNRGKIDLNNQINAIHQLESEVNSLVGNVNTFANVLNRLVHVLNLGVSQYNSVGTQRGEEFEEGVYISSLRGSEIDIYEFSDNKQLVRVLEHELGHALNLNHLENPEAVMYKLNQSQDVNLTEDDIAALKSRCGVD